MKLLNCKLLQIEEFYGTSIPKSYAILSHRWELEEVTYKDLQTPGLGMTKAGWAKINDFCRIALDNGYEYGWVDTCCIDKRNLTELTEAINSMFKWYANSSVCYAYLSDILSGQPVENSLWFTRGWTLQELIAPSRMMFFDKKWEFIGTRDSLGDFIQLRSRVDKEMLEDTALPRNITNMLSTIPVARRMSWASERTTTREEDRAYSLLGIFGVNMPMLYGEGSRAFMHLQEEIAKETNDLSLFAWTRQENSCANPANPSEGTTGAELPEEEGSKPCGILATSPDEFRLSSDLVLKRDIMHNPESSVAANSSVGMLTIIFNGKAIIKDKKLLFTSKDLLTEFDSIR
ncbi:unnamed protein product [Colletotrichum noveboracense]|uniref:HET domain-containing protein n=1 Tax=Colletotrichum noveboracense TaxID=2664923 RepID=A0A9W4S222_9PEZI|nr:unnamed protein product [Colletotrichum noveboracense]